MARIENTSSRPFDITLGAVNGVGGRLFQIPRGKGGDSNDQNGIGEIDDALFAEHKDKDVFLKALLDSGELVVKASSPSPTEKTRTVSTAFGGDRDDTDSKAHKK